MSSVWGKLRGASEHLRARGDHDASENDTAILRALERFYEGAGPTWLGTSQSEPQTAQDARIPTTAAHRPARNDINTKYEAPESGISNSTSLQDILQRSSASSPTPQPESPLHRPERTRSGLASKLKRANW